MYLLQFSSENLKCLQTRPIQLGISIEVWAWENPTVWGNYRGANAYVYNEAWGKGAEEKLIHNKLLHSLFRTSTVLSSDAFA
jgi:hypothetical protein